MGVCQAATVSKSMHSLVMIFPGFILSLSLFHFSMTLHRFQSGFDSLTPSVIQRYVTTSIQSSSVQFWLDPDTVRNGIASYFSMQFSEEQTLYTLEFQFYQSDQISSCNAQCFGVLTTLNIHLQIYPISFSRHYQLVTK